MHLSRPQSFFQCLTKPVRRIHPSGRDTEGVREGDKIWIGQPRFVLFLVGRTLEIADHAIGIVVDDDQREADLVTHTGSEFLGGIEETTITDNANYWLTRPCDLRSDCPREAEAEQP